MAGSSVSIDLTANLAKWTTSIDKATNDLSKFASNAEKNNAKIASSFDKLFLGLKTIIPAGLFTAFLKNTIDTADHLKDLSETTGFSIETLVGLETIAKKSGASLEDLTGGIKKLGNAIFQANTGNAKLKTLLESIGVTSKNSKEALFQLADAFKNTIPEAEKQAVAMQLLGRSNDTLINTLNQGADALKRMDESTKNYAKSMSDLAPNADKFNEMMLTFRNNITGAAAVMLNDMLPTLGIFATRIKNIIELESAGGLFNTFKLWGDTGADTKTTKEAIAATEQVIAKWKEAGRETGAWEEKLKKLNAVLVVLKKQSQEAALALGEGFANYKVANYSIEQSVTATMKLSELQDAMKKAFDTGALEKFASKFADARQKIQVEYAKLKASFTSAPASEATGLDLNATIQQGKRALSGGDAVQAQALLDKAKEIFSVVSGKDTTTSYEKTYFSDTLKNFELAMVDNQEQLQKVSTESFRTAVDKSISDIGKFNIPIDVDAMVAQFKQALSLMQAEMQRNPLQPANTYVPQYSSDGRVSVDISKSALQYGRR